MYFIMLNVCACILLLSSVLTIAILLKKQFKQWKGTPLYILSISDVLFSMFTSSILFTNCIIHFTYINHNKVNSVFPVSDNIWNIERGNENQQIKLESFAEKLNTVINPDYFNAIPKCNIISIIMKYGMLFFPFVNSFVSLLIFSVECNLNVFYLKKQCFKFLHSEEAICEDDTSINKFNSEIKFDSVIKSKNISVIKQYMKNILYVFNYNETKKDKTITTIFVLSQWIIPVIITGLLYLSEYNTNLTRDMENKKCFIESILFLDDCHNNIKSINMFQNPEFETDTAIVYDNFTSNEDYIKFQTFNITQVNEIISKVQNLIFSTMNDISTMSFNTTSYNISEVIDKTKYLDTYIKDIEQNKNAGNVFNPVSVKNNTNLQSDIQLSNYTNRVNGESLLFDYLMKNSSRDTLRVKIYNNEINTNTTEKLNVRKLQTDVSENKGTINNFMNTTEKYNILIMSNDSKYHNNKEVKELKELKPTEIFLHTKINIYQNDNTSKTMQVYIIDKCFVSIEFLKVHLLILVFIIYFLPILFSSILQQYGKLNCKIVLEKLKAKNKILLNNFKSEYTNEINNMYFDVPMNSKGFTLKQKFTYLDENPHTQELVDFNKLQLMRIHHEDFNQKWNKHCKDNKHNISFDETKIQLNIISQRATNMLQLFDSIKMSLLSGVLLWTPLFFECLIKVFTVLYIPEWLLNITYLTGIAFSTLRNIFNLKMIKLQEKDINTTKINSIHPIT